MFRKVLVVAGAIASVWCATAHAQERDQRDRAVTGEEHRPVRVGAVGGIGFPRPIAIEPMVVLADRIALGAEYGVLPTVNVGGVQTGLWSLSGDVRVFPFRNGFFVGLSGGRQHIGAETTVTLGRYGSANEALALDTWFLNPRLGFLWTSRHGLTLGFDAGVQIPLSSSTTSSLPLAFAPGAQHTVAMLGGSWLPTVDLLRVGLLL